MTAETASEACIVLTAGFATALLFHIWWSVDDIAKELKRRGR